MNTEFEWWHDTEANDGAGVWYLMAESDYLAENYWAKILGSGPYTWKVGMGFPEGVVLENGETDTLEKAQQQAEQAWSRAMDE